MTEITDKSLKKKKKGGCGERKVRKERKTGQEPVLFPRPVALGFRAQTQYFPEKAGVFIAQQALPCSLRAPTSVSNLAVPQQPEQ